MISPNLSFARALFLEYQYHFGHTSCIIYLSAFVDAAAGDGDDGTDVEVHIDADDDSVDADIAAADGVDADR